MPLAAARPVIPAPKAPAAKPPLINNGRFIAVFPDNSSLHELPSIKEKT
jgi:hypothetical protein